MRKLRCCHVPTQPNRNSLLVGTWQQRSFLIRSFLHLLSLRFDLLLLASYFQRPLSYVCVFPRRLSNFSAFFLSIRCRNTVRIISQGSNDGFDVLARNACSSFSYHASIGLGSKTDSSLLGVSDTDLPKRLAAGLSLFCKCICSNSFLAPF